MYSLLIPTPIGPLYAEASRQGIGRVRLLVLGQGLRERPNKLLETFSSRVEGYFAHRGESFLDLPLDYGETPAHRIALYEAVRQIPYGQTCSYAALGRGLALTPRAVGAGMRACSWFLLVPAQRVIHADGRLGGFMGREGIKKWLLQHEGVAV